MTVIMMPLVLVCGGLMAITPALMPATECFTVSIPPSAQRDSRIRAYRRSYLVAMLAVSCVATAWVGSFAAAHGVGPADSPLFAATMVIATLTPVIVGLVLMSHFRSRVRQLKEDEGWTAVAQRSAALVAEGDAPQPISLAWDLLYAALAIVLAAFALVNYDRFPERIPMRMSFDGTVTVWADRSVGTVLFPTLMAAFVGLVFTFCHWIILRSKRPVNPGAPATSALAYAIFARTQTLMLLIGGLALTTGIGVLFNLASLGAISLGAAGIAMGALVVAFAGAETWLAVSQGQSGARIAEELHESAELHRDDDVRWMLGTLYRNSDDPSLFVPRRFGVGWTMNVARRGTWALFGLFVLAIAAFVWATMVLVG